VRETFHEATRRAQREYLAALMRETGGVVSDAAERAGMNRQNFYRTLSRLGVPYTVRRRPEPKPAPMRRANRGNAAWQSLGA